MAVFNVIQVQKMEKTTDAGTLPHPVFNEDHCKGCGRCVAACPKKVLRIKTTLNKRGVNPAEYVGEGCIGCAMCFYNCPEPYAIKVVKA